MNVQLTESLQRRIDNWFEAHSASGELHVGEVRLEKGGVYVYAMVVTDNGPAEDVPELLVDPVDGTIQEIEPGGRAFLEAVGIYEKRDSDGTS